MQIEREIDLYSPYDEQAYNEGLTALFDIDIDSEDGGYLANLVFVKFGGAEINRGMAIRMYSKREVEEVEARVAEEFTQ